MGSAIEMDHLPSQKCGRFQIEEYIGDLAYLRQPPHGTALVQRGVRLWSWHGRMRDPRRDRMKADALFGTLSRQGARHRCQAAFRQVGETGWEARDRLAAQRGGDRHDIVGLLQTHL